MKDSGAGCVGVHPGLDELVKALACVKGFEDAAGHAVGGGEGAVGAAVHEEDAVGIGGIDKSSRGLAVAGRVGVGLAAIGFDAIGEDGPGFAPVG